MFHLTCGVGSDGGERRTFLGGAQCDHPGCFDPWLSCVFRARARALERGLISIPSFRPRINLPPQDGKNRLSRRRSASEIKRDSLVPDSTSAVRPPTPPSDGRGPHRQPSPSSPLFVPAALPAFLMRPRGEALAMSPLADVAQPPISPPRQGLELPPISYILGPAFERQSPPYAYVSSLAAASAATSAI